jgi:hypothetical protein
MKHLGRFRFAFVGLAMAVPTITYAHFKLVEPASWLIESDRGDPQKAGPCGGSNTDWGKPSNIVGKAVGGQKLHIKVQETIYHPGHYRVALSISSRSELPLDPVATTKDSDKGPWSVSALIQNPVQIPVLADGLFVHATRPTGQADPFETDVQLPNVSCRKCTLQVVQFMEDHGFNNPGGYTYHHCADLQIAADSSKPLDKGWPADR